MIVVNVHLESAISKSRSAEIARVYIANVGGDEVYGDYACMSVRGRGADSLDKKTPQRRGKVLKHARQREHVLNLVAKALLSMGYGNGRAGSSNPLQT